MATNHQNLPGDDARDRQNVPDRDNAPEADAANLGSGAHLGSGAKDSHDDHVDDLPAALAGDLVSLFRAEITIPDAVDRKILAAAETHWATMASDGSATAPEADSDSETLSGEPGDLSDAPRLLQGLADLAAPGPAIPADLDTNIRSQAAAHFASFSATDSQGDSEIQDTSPADTGSDLDLGDEFANLPAPLKRLLLEAYTSDIEVPSYVDDLILTQAWEHWDSLGGSALEGNGSERQEFDQADLPAALLKQIRADYAPPIAIPQAIDQAVGIATNEHFTSQFGVEDDAVADEQDDLAPISIQQFQMPKAVTWFAQAAAVAIVCWIGYTIFQTEPRKPGDGSSTNPVAVQGDIDGNGVVDVLDAFAVARQLRDGKATTPQMDVNQDGIVDQQDVNTLAAMAVDLAPDVASLPGKKTPTRPATAWATMPAGSPAQMRDPRQWQNPNKLDVTRSTHPEPRF